LGRKPLPKNLSKKDVQTAIEMVPDLAKKLGYEDVL